MIGNRAVLTALILNEYFKILCFEKYLHINRGVSSSTAAGGGCLNCRHSADERHFESAERGKGGGGGLHTVHWDRANFTPYKLVPNSKFIV